jgi:hypothetical protein
MRPFGSLFAKPGLGEPGGLYDAREACLINEIDLRVLRLRVKDKHAAVLKAQGKEANFVWNYTQDLGLKVLGREERFVSAFGNQPRSSE